jgi:hypothetical protein
MNKNPHYSRYPFSMSIFRDYMLFQSPVHLETQPMAPEYEVTAAILTASFQSKQSSVIEPRFTGWKQPERYRKTIKAIG